MSGEVRIFVRRQPRDRDLSKLRARDAERFGDSQRRIRARRQVQYALETGALQRAPCEVCGDPTSQAHHDDYDKPLEVRWLCPTHHATERYG